MFTHLVLLPKMELATGKMKLMVEGVMTMRKSLFVYINQYKPLWAFAIPEKCSQLA